MTNIVTSNTSAALRRLFDEQAGMAIQLSGDEVGVKALFPLLEKIGSVREGEGRLPFIIVVQRSGLTLQERMAKVVLSGCAGTCKLKDDYLFCLDPIPQGHYLAVDIEDGRAKLNTYPGVGQKELRAEGRFGGTALEGASLISYQPGILQHHFVDLSGSCYGRGRHVPNIRIFKGVPQLVAFWRTYRNPFFGPMSCSSRLGLEALK